MVYFQYPCLINKWIQMISDIKWGQKPSLIIDKYCSSWIAMICNDSSLLINFYDGYDKQLSVVSFAMFRHICGLRAWHMLILCIGLHFELQLGQSAMAAPEMMPGVTGVQWHALTSQRKWHRSRNQGRWSQQGYMSHIATSLQRCSHVYRLVVHDITVRTEDF